MQICFFLLRSYLVKCGRPVTGSTRNQSTAVMQGSSREGSEPANWSIELGGFMMRQHRPHHPSGKVCSQEYAGLPGFCRSQVRLPALNAALAAAARQCSGGAGSEFTADTLAEAAGGARGGRAAVSSLLKLGRARAVAMGGSAAYHLA